MPSPVNHTANTTNPETVSTELELRDYLAVLRRRRGLIVAITAAVVLAVVAISLLQTSIYRATAEVLLRPRTAEQLLSDGEAAENPQMALVRTETEIQVMKSSSVRDAAADDLGFRASVSIQARGETDVVAISAESPDAERAAEVANTYAETYVRIRREVLVAELLAAMDEVQAQLDQIEAEQTRLDEPSEALEARRVNYMEQLDELQLSSELATGGAQIVSRADVPTSPVKPTSVRNALLGLVLGLTLAIAAAFLRDHLDDSIRTREDLEKVSGGTSLLGVVPLVPDWKDRAAPTLISVTAPKSAPAEAYRTLRTSLQFVGLDNPTHITQITSPGSSDGKTTTLSNLGVSLAATGQRVLMVDCDLRRPRLHEFFGTRNDVGFTSLLLGTRSLDSAIQQVADHENLALLPSGPPPPNPAEILASPTAAELVRTLAADYDIVLLDSPPVLPVTDALVLARMAAATIVVVAAGTTRRRDAARAFELLDQIDAPVVGAVLNDATSSNGYETTYDSYVYAYGPRPDHRALSRFDLRRLRPPGIGRTATTGNGHEADEEPPSVATRRPD
jgi:polysaccharide biosynthesis transport protein